MSDPDLVASRGDLKVPVLGLVGASERVVTPAYGRAVAAAIPTAEFAVVPEAGHLPHLENPAAPWPPIDAFIEAPRLNPTIGRDDRAS